MGSCASRPSRAHHPGAAHAAAAAGRAAGLPPAASLLRRRPWPLCPRWLRHPPARPARPVRRPLEEPQREGGQACVRTYLHEDGVHGLQLDGGVGAVVLDGLDELRLEPVAPLLRGPPRGLGLLEARVGHRAAVWGARASLGRVRRAQAAAHADARRRAGGAEQAPLSSQGKPGGGGPGPPGAAPGAQQHEDK